MNDIEALKARLSLIGNYLREDQVLAISTYHSGDVLFIKPRKHGQPDLVWLKRDLPSGITSDNNSLFIASSNCIEKISLRSLHEAFTLVSSGKMHGVVEEQMKASQSVNTGKVLCHEIQSVSNELYYVNTRYSTISLVKQGVVEESYWTPPFITEFTPEDYCHLNGFAFIDGIPRYATCLAGTNFAKGWRLFPYSSGLLIDIVADRVIATQLVLPHSPRIYQDSILLLESGNASLTKVSLKTHQTERLANLPGFARGLAISSGYAFIGLSSIRNSNLWLDLPVRKTYRNTIASLAILDLSTLAVLEVIELDKIHEEIFDLQIFTF